MSLDLASKEFRRWLVRVIFCLVVAVLAWLVLSGCAQKRRPLPSAPAPAPVSTVEVRRAVAATRQHGLNAQTRVQTVIREVERLKLVADPATATELDVIRAELLRADAELVKLRESIVEAETALVASEKQAADLRTWGITQQQTAEANADGWRASEAVAAEAIRERDKARTVANKRGNLVGLLGAGTLGALALKFVSLAVPWTLLLPVAGSALGYFGARFIL